MDIRSFNRFTGLSLSVLVTLRVWTKSSLAARRRTLEQRNPILARARALQCAETKELDLLDRRVENSLTPIGRLPTEILVLIFRNTNVVCWYPVSYYAGRNPMKLAAVCHRWFDVIIGPPGACLWTNLAAWYNNRFGYLPAVRCLRTALPRSRPLPFDISLHWHEASISPNSMPVDVQTITHLVASELRRCRSLSVGSVAVFRGLFPLTGRYDHLQELYLNFKLGDQEILPRRKRVSPLCMNSSFPALRCLELSNLYDLTEEAAWILLGNTSLTSKCTELTLYRFYCTLPHFVRLLHMFPNLTSLELENGNDVDEQKLEEMVTNPESAITLPHLRTLRFQDVETAVLLPLFNVPLLTSIYIDRGDNFGNAHISLVPAAYPQLHSLRFDSVDMADVDLAQIAATRGSVRSIRYDSPIDGMLEVLQQLFTYASDPASTPGDPQTVGENADPLVLILVCRDEDYIDEEELRDEDRQFLLQLEALSSIQQLRERVYGSGFRIHIAQKFAQRFPLLMEVVLRFPEFLETVRASWWEDSS